MTGTNMWSYNDGAPASPLAARYKFYDVTFNSGNFELTNAVGLSVSSVLLGSDPLATTDRSKHIIFGETSNIVAKNSLTLRGAYTEIDSGTGKLKYETQEYLQNSGFIFNGTLSIAGQLKLDNANGSNGAVYTNLTIGSTAHVTAASYAMSDGSLTVNSVAGDTANLAVTGAFAITKGTVNVGGKVTAGSLTMADGSLSVNSGNLSVSGAASVTKGTINVNGTASAASVVLSSASADASNVINFTIGSGATFTTTGGFEANYTSNLTVNGTLNVGGYLNLSKNTAATAGPGFTIGEGASITAGQFRSGYSQVVLARNSSLIVRNTIGGTTWLSAGGQGNLIANEGSYLEITSATGTITMYNGVTMNGTFKIETPFYWSNGFTVNTSGNTLKANMALSARFTVNAANDFSETRIMTNVAQNNVDVNANLSLKAFAFIANSKLNVNLADGVLLTLVNLSSAYDSTYLELGSTNLLIFKNFSERSVLLRNHSEADDGLLAYVRVNSETDTSQLAWVYSDAASGWYLSVVPEPAEYAAIFGALALAFAAYRRRK